MNFDRKMVIFTELLTKREEKALTDARNLSYTVHKLIDCAKRNTFTQKGEPI